MANYSSKDVGFLLVGPYNLAGVSNKFEDNTLKAVEDTTPFGVTHTTYEPPGLVKYELTGHEGWYDDATDSINAALVDMASAENVLMIAFQGNTPGKQAICTGGAIKVGYKRSFAVGEFHKASMDLSISGVKDDATIVHELVQVAGDGNTETAHVDLDATGGGTTGGNVYLSCTQLTLSGRTGFTVTLEDSVDHATWADHTVMTALTAVGAEKKVATDMTVNRYLCTKWAFAGAAGSPTATFALAFKVNAPH